MPEANATAEVRNPSGPADNFAEHERTYRAFVRGVFLFAAHVLVILVILAWLFSGSFGTTSLAG